jgi:Tol biopolymer transport system component
MSTKPPLVSARWIILAAVATLTVAPPAPAGEEKKPPLPPHDEAAARAALALSQIPCRIVYETFRDGNWELYSIKADGSGPVNLTKTPKVNELYPHVSPDGTKVSFVVDECDEGSAEPRVRNAYYMNIDGTGRTKVADNIREACWKGDGTALALLPCEFDRFTYEDYATRGVRFYDLKTGKTADHPNKDLYHLYNLCWSPDGQWLVATVHGGMGFKHSILALEAGGTKVFDLRLPGCRPDLSPDGKKIAWGASDWELCVADIDFGGTAPKISNRRAVVKSGEPIKIYHIDWSPDGRYVAFSRGPERKTLHGAPEMIGNRAVGWNICVADSGAASLWLEITSDGNCDKEPDWAPLGAGGAR